MNEEIEVRIVKEIGEKIGYGHLMFLASALWRKSLKDEDFPVSGAFVPTLIEYIEPEMVELSKEESKLYDKIIEQSL